MPKLRYLVQMADSYDYDFGGVNGGIAAFHHKGDAYVYAKDINDKLGRAARVLDTNHRRSKEVFVFEGKNR